MRHDVVYAEQGIYAGWPANHGAWQWGDEFLVGFLRGKYGKGTFHKISEPFQKVLARSQDGGETWDVETPNVDFDCIAPSSAPTFDIGKNIIRVSGCYDTGGDYCYEQGGFYLSADRGHTWNGAYKFAGLEAQFSGDLICTSRTRRHGDLLFLTNGQRDIWGTDACFCATHDGERFHFKATVCEDDARAAMPAVAEAGGRIVVTLRRRKSGRRDGWIDAFGSDDGGASWRFLSYVGSTGHHNGNPSALIATDDGRLVCVYGNRDEGSMCYAVSNDRGATWDGRLLRGSDTDKTDIGYPQLFKRTDGRLCAVYYFVDARHGHQFIARTIFEP